jgi:oligoribonuclease NrnB/cAMP/cGMP phosphodiesterase (DHH superfamily)
MTDGGCGEIKPFTEEMVNLAPGFTKLIADYDVWTFIYGDDTRAFEKGFILYPHEPTDEIWEKLCDYEFSCNDTSLVKEIIHRGKTIIAYRKSLMTEYCRHKGFEAVLDGYKVFAVNMAMLNSNDFIVDNPEDYDMFVGFSFDGDIWNYSLRAVSDVDCSEVAKKYGGGGHRGAAGCNTDYFILKKVKKS